MKKILPLGLALGFFVFGSAWGVDKKGKFGLGFFNDDAPLGGRYWVTDKIGIDFGFGIDLRNVVDSTVSINLAPLKAPNPGKKTLSEIRLDGGVPFNVIQMEKVNFLIRPGFTYQRRSYFFPLTHDSIETKEVVIRIEYDSLGGFDTAFTDTLRFNRGTIVDSADVERAREFDLNFTLGMEYFPTENFSVSLFSGLGVRNERRTQFKRGANGSAVLDSNGNKIKGDSFWTATHRPFVKGVNIGFHFYF